MNPHTTSFFPFLLFFHSLLRWGILLSVAVAGTTALTGWLRRRPVINWQRSVAIAAMVLCHMQLIAGAILHGTDLGTGRFSTMPPDRMQYWKWSHAATMLLAIALVTAGRMLSKRARTDQGKHLRTAIFYLAALTLMLWAMPWPSTAMGAGRSWV